MTTKGVNTGFRVYSVDRVFMASEFGGLLSRRHHAPTHSIQSVPLSILLPISSTYIYTTSFTLVYHRPVNTAIEIYSYTLTLVLHEISLKLVTREF